jgi:hypothetical protein
MIQQQFQRRSRSCNPKANPKGLANPTGSKSANSVKVIGRKPVERITVRESIAADSTNTRHWSVIRHIALKQQWFYVREVVISDKFTISGNKDYRKL